MSDIDPAYILRAGGIGKLQTIIDLLLERIVALEQGGGGGGGGALLHALEFDAGPAVDIGPSPGPGVVTTLDMSLAGWPADTRFYVIAGLLLINSGTPSYVRIAASPDGFSTVQTVVPTDGGASFAFVAVALPPTDPLVITANADTDCNVSMSIGYVMPIAETVNTID